MSHSFDVRAEMLRIVSSKPVYAAAGAGVVASRTLRELPGRLARWRGDATVARGYMMTARARAGQEYDRLADRGRRALAARAARPGGRTLGG